MSDLTVALVLRAVDRLSGPLKRAGRAVGLLAREAQRSGRQMRAAGAGSEHFARSQRHVRQTVEQTTRAVQRQAEDLRRLARAREEAAKRLRERGLAAAGKLAAGGAAATAGAYGVKRLVEGAINPLRAVEKAKGELMTLDPKNIEVWMRTARQAQRQISGMMAADFLRAGYDIKSALSDLTDEAQASMTKALAWTAKATQASAPEMAELFTSVFGVYRQQFKKLSDAEFGDVIAGMTARAVRAFKTSGPKLKQALQSATAAPSKIGMSMAEVYATLGMLQTSIEPGEAGTALKAFASKAAEAEQRFRKMKLSTRLLDEKGMLRKLPDILDDLQRAFGKTLDAREMAAIQKAFGSEEAIKLIANLWSQQAALRQKIEEVRAGGQRGLPEAMEMARRGIANLDDRLVLLAQKWDLLKQQIGEAFAPVLERLIPVVANAIDWFSALMKQYPKLATGIATAVVGFGALLAVAGPLMMALSTLVGTLTMAAFAFRLFRAAKLRGMAAEILQVGAAMDSVARKKWRLPRLLWRMAIAPLRWAMFVPRLAWRAFVSPLRWAGGIIARIPWGALAGRLRWDMLIRPLRWAAALIPRIPWGRVIGVGSLATAGQLAGRLLGRKVLAGLAMFIPYVGPAISAALIGWDIWDTIIKPLAWDKYILPTLASAWAAVRARVQQAWAAIRNMTPLDWARLALTGLPGVVASIIRSFTGIDLTGAGARIMQSLWTGLKSVASGLLDWVSKIGSKIAGALGVGGKTVRGMRTRSSAPKAPETDIPMFARGGWMRGGMPAIVGERGPELIFPTRAAWVASNDNPRCLGGQQRQPAPPGDPRRTGSRGANAGRSRRRGDCAHRLAAAADAARPAARRRGPCTNVCLHRASSWPAGRAADHRAHDHQRARPERCPRHRAGGGQGTAALHSLCSA